MSLGVSSINRAPSPLDAKLAQTQAKLSETKDLLAAKIQSHLRTEDRIDDIPQPLNASLFRRPERTLSPISNQEITTQAPSRMALVCNAISSFIRGIITAISNFFANISGTARPRIDSDASTDSGSSLIKTTPGFARGRVDSDDDSYVPAPAPAAKKTSKRQLDPALSENYASQWMTSGTSRLYVLPVTKEALEIVLSKNDETQNFFLKQALKHSLERDADGTIDTYGHELISAIRASKSPQVVNVGRLAELAQRTKELTPKED
jgi:hypothetical protein